MESRAKVAAWLYLESRIAVKSINNSHNLAVPAFGGLDVPLFKLVVGLPVHSLGLWRERVVNTLKAA